jgi:predicted RNA-binding protein YlqC (UPF0109 family)
MDNLLSYILKGICSNTEDIEIQTIDEDNFRIFQIKVNEIDVPKVIGKHGATIKAINELLFLYLKKNPDLNINKVHLKLD